MVEDTIKDGGWQCNIKYFDDYVIKTPKTEEEIRAKVKRYLASKNKLDELEDRVRDMQEDWTNSIKLIKEKNVPLSLFAFPEFLKDGKIKQKKVVMLDELFLKLRKEKKAKELKELMLKIFEAIKEFWRYGLVDKTGKVSSEFGLLDGKVVLIDFGELSDIKEIAEKQIVKMKWYENLAKYNGEEIAKLFIKLAKKELTLESLDELWGEKNKQSSMKLIIREIKNKKELDEVFRIRDEVFVKGQNVPKEMEIDEEDEKATHIIVLLGEKPVGCARIVMEGNRARLGRIAILDECRGKGYGKDLVKFLVKFCLDKKVKEIYMHAQYYLNKFYSELGFVDRGEIFDEAEIKHIEMVYKPQ